MIDPTCLIYDFLIEKITSTRVDVGFIKLDEDIDGGIVIKCGRYKIFTNRISDLCHIWFGHHGEFTVSLSEPDALDQIWDFINCQK